MLYILFVCTGLEIGMVVVISFLISAYVVHVCTCSQDKSHMAIFGNGQHRSMLSESKLWWLYLKTHNQLCYTHIHQTLCQDGRKYRKTCPCQNKGNSSSPQLKNIASVDLGEIGMRNGILLVPQDHSTLHTQLKVVSFKVAGCYIDRKVLLFC